MNDTFSDLPTIYWLTSEDNGFGKRVIQYIFITFGQPQVSGLIL